jgi:hypothetical protein
MIISPDLLNQPQPGNERLGVNITLGDITIPLTPYNTLVRRFGYGDGEYDNCIVLEDGHKVEFLPTPEFKEELESKGAPTTFKAIPDKVAMSYYARSLFDNLWQQGLK